MPTQWTQTNNGLLVPQQPEPPPEPPRHVPSDNLLYPQGQVGCIRERIGEVTRLTSWDAAIAAAGLGWEEWT